MKRDLRYEELYPYPIDRVWEAITDPDAISDWLMPTDFAPRLGHKFQFRTKPEPGFDGIVNCEVMVDPAKGGHPTMLVSGNDSGAKKQIADFLKALGWRDIIDIGDITKSRGTEMLLPLWMNLFGLFGNPHFGFKIVRGS